MQLDDVDEFVHHLRLPLLPDDDLKMMRDSIRKFLAEVLPQPNADCASWVEIDPDSFYWSRMATELGLQGLTIPESAGGQGFGMSEASIVFEELGRALCSAPLLSTTALAARAIQLSNNSDTSLLAQIAAGEAKATAKFDDYVNIVATSDPEPRLDGTLSAVLEGMDAGYAIVLATSTEGVNLYSIDLKAPGVSVAAQDSMDLTRSFTRIHLHGAPGQLLASAPLAHEIVTRTLDEATICLSAESVGAARRALELAVEYSRTRQQFGQPIGSFQALKHRMADMLALIEGAWSTVRYASVLAAAVDDRPDIHLRDLSRAASVAKVASDRAFKFAASECIQIHGGIGFTWEYLPHLLFRRAASNAQLLGSARFHRARIVELQLK